ncbi:hypothetical protein O1M63_34615 [Streptomyces mirabilis]|nr:hypothetical protein [Streptomyces mirabilis]
MELLAPLVPPDEPVAPAHEPAVSAPTADPYAIGPDSHERVSDEETERVTDKDCPSGRRRSRRPHQFPGRAPVVWTPRRCGAGSAASTGARRRAAATWRPRSPNRRPRRPPRTTPHGTPRRTKRRTRCAGRTQ